MTEPKVEIRKLSEFRPLAANPNRHTQRGLRALEDSVQEDGWVAPITVTADGESLDGAARLEVAADKFDDEALVVSHDGRRPVIMVRSDIADAKTTIARRIAFRANRIAEIDLDWDLGQILADAEALPEGLWTDDELAELLAQAGMESDPPADAEPQVDRADELQEKWGVQSGDLWRIGEHRLLCGDSTVRADVERVMRGEKAEMIWTDPPYGVAVGDKNVFLNSIARSNRIEENLVNDTLDESNLVKILCLAFDNAIEHCAAGGAWYVAAPAGPLHILFGQVLKDRGIWRQTIQWVKNNATFSPMGVCYHWQAEPIFFGWLPNAAHRYYGGRAQTTVWEIDRPLKSPEHPTMKPVELVSRAIENSSREGEIVFDPFVGSGTTILAAQNLGRQCRAIEISEKYVAVCLQRMSDAFPDLEIERLE